MRSDIRQMLRRVGFFDALPSNRHPFDQGGLTGQESDSRLPSPLLIRSIFPTGDMRDELPVYHSAADRFLDIVLLFTPALLLGALAAESRSAAMGIGAIVFAVVGAAFLRSRKVWQPPASGAIILLYLLAFGWCWHQTRNGSGTLAPAVRGIVLLIAVVLTALYDLYRTGAEPRRRAKHFCARICNRQFWPSQVSDIRALPEVRGLRDAVAIEPGPVFPLLTDPNMNVRIAAFSALDGRTAWRSREAATVLNAAQRASEPSVRGVAVGALATIDDPAVVQGLAEFLRDPDAEVRAAAVAAILSQRGRKWAFVRDAVRAYLSDAKFTSDGGLPGATGYLPVMATCDLTVWAGEPEPLGGRAVRSLVEHYSRILETTGDYDLVTDLARHVTDPHTPAGLRVELASLLRSFEHLTPELLDRMTNSDQPGAVRLLAAEAILTANPNDSDGIDVLRGLGRQPNREMALAIARVLQQRLGIDLGLPLKGIAINSKQAGEIAKRVLQWATGRTINGLPTPGVGMPPLTPVPRTSSESAGSVPMLPPAKQMKLGRKPW